MPFTMVGWSQSIDAGSLATIDALADQHVRTEGDYIVVPELNALISAWAFGANATRARLVSPSLRQIAVPDIGVMRGSTLFDDYHTAGFRLGPVLELQTDEQLGVEVSEDAAGASLVTAFALLADNVPDPVDPRGAITVKATHGALTANTWSNAQLTFEQSLPVGRYAVIGARHVSGNAVAFRLVGVGDVWRPGGFSRGGVQNVDPLGQRYGGWGVWMEFEHLRPPSIDVYATAADASGTLYLDLLRVS